jgi:crotonobetainyl-CoA:carnitine CoA-transferase CaiB-like acyl-CoA transferase
MRRVLPLEGIRVLDLSRVLAGPYCTMLLADLGAAVVKVERPGEGDETRTWGPPYAGGEAAYFLSVNRGKRSIAVDLGKPEGQEVVRRLARSSDVVLENFRRGTAKRLGVGYDDLERDNPRLVYCSISGYGQTGPLATRPAMDMAVQAASGVMAKTGFADGPPVRAGIAIGDHVAASFGALGVVAALRQRDLTGRGQHVDLAMLDVLSALVWDEPVDHYAAVGMPVRTGNADPRGAPINVYACTDGWVAVTLSSDEQWRGLCKVMGRDELIERWPTVRERARAASEVDATVAGWAATLPAADVEAAFLDCGIAAARVRDPVAALDDPHLAARELFEPLRHPAATAPSGFLGPRLPIAFDGRAASLPPAETLGTSTDAVLRDAGFSAAEIAALRERGVVA